MKREIGKLEIGVKADPILYRYSYPWLFSLMERLGVVNLQFGSFFEMYRLPDRYFLRIASQAAEHGIRIRSCFTSHRELGGFFVNDPDLHQVAFDSYRRYIEIGALLGAEAVGSNPGSIHRDDFGYKEQGINNYLEAMNDLSRFAYQAGLKTLTVEPMSCSAEPPSTEDEITRFMDTLGRLHGESPDTTVPVYLCADISHGLADEKKSIVTDNLALFRHCIPWMWEFHFKNTDALFNSTFGFSADERQRGIVSLAELRGVVLKSREDFPDSDPVGYIELPGPKLGRDYSDNLLKQNLEESILAVQELYVDG